MLILCLISLILCISGAPTRDDAECDLDTYENNSELFTTRNAAVPQSLWPGGVIPYVIDESLDFLIDTIESVMDEYENATCIRFKPIIDAEFNYVKIYLGNGCSSMVGRFPISHQLISLGFGCHSVGTITHEIGHTIGLHHEHNRSDRDDYLEIIWDNIKPGRENQFKKLLPEEIVLLNKFDYNSIMLYGDTTFSKNGYSKTMIAKKKGINRLLRVADKSGLSKSDIERINKLYNCSKS
uniref:Metalloendopeptidase n=1 Tax=Tityus serrulatus TaxID=6887 RepID=U6JPA2_TITSE|nr:astacin-like metallopeptidase 7 protein [Tityus serrulatus]